jgi:peptide deformylase
MWSWCRIPELCNLHSVYVGRIKLSYYNQLNIQGQHIILQLKHYVSNMFQSFIDHHQRHHTSDNAYKI